jgi:hypothetical protein
MTNHARLGPSGAHRWMGCPLSVRLSEQVEIKPAGTAAAAGNIMHTAFERRMLGQGDITQQEILELGFLDIGQSKAKLIVDQGVEAAYKVLAQFGIDDYLCEQRVDPGQFIGRTDFWGTADLIGANESNKTFLVGDLKTGRGRVDPQFNEQMLSYALGALDLIDFVPERIVLAIIQPPLLGATAAVWVTDIQTLEKFKEFARAQAAFTDDLECQPNPSTEVCQWCPAKSICPAHQNK